MSCKNNPENQTKIDGENYTFNFKQTCKKGVTFSERGIKGYGLVYLKNAMVNVSIGGRMFEKNVKNDKKIDILSQQEGEICILLRNENMSQTDQIFYCIRNALAHGLFSYIKGVYIFENFNRGKLKGRIRINQKTLLKWIDLCSMGVEEIIEIAKN